MQYLPTSEEQAWLIRALSDLINMQGRDHFVSMPIVEPSPKFFPDNGPLRSGDSIALFAG